MSTDTQIDPALRARILDDPQTILDDPELLQALVAANDAALGSNVVDLRGVAMDRLEARFDRLEETHRTVIATAYENLAGTSQIHRAVLRLLDALDFETFLADLGGEVAGIMQVAAVRLILESAEDGAEEQMAGLSDVLAIAPRGFVDQYSLLGRSLPARQVVLRQIERGEPELYGDLGADLRSEACLRLDFGPGRLPGLLVLASTDPGQFAPQHGTDLLGFFGGVFERTMRRWLG